MNAKEKLRNALRAYDQIEPAEDAWERINARADAKRPLFWRGHALVAGLAVVVAMGAIVGVRLIADRNSGVRLVTPVVGPTADVSLLPSPTSSGSPSASPSPSPTEELHYVSADGIWELSYPKDWFGPGVAPTGDFTNFRTSRAEVDNPIKLDLVVDVYTAQKDASVDELLKLMCEESSGRQILECKKAEINGLTWGWALVYSDEFEVPQMWLSMRTSVNGTGYMAVGYVGGKSGHEPGIAEIREVFESVVLNV